MNSLWTSRTAKTVIMSLIIASAMGCASRATLTLPHEASVATDDSAFTIINTGEGDAIRGATSGDDGVGVYGETFGPKGYGVYGWAKDQGGVRNYGGYFRADGDVGRGVYGTSPYWGVTGVARGEEGRAVFGEATNEGDATNYGGYFVARGKSGRGVYASGGPEGSAAELRGNVTIQDWYTGDVRIRLAPGGPARTAAEFRGNVTILDWDGGEVLIELGEGLDIAEGFDVIESQGIEAGSVLVIDPNHPGQLSISRRPYDKRVAGVVSGAGGLGSAMALGARDFDHTVALAGRVYCNVDATLQAVEPGDLLTTATLPGYAMKADDPSRSAGAILGKAMEGLEQGEKGQILVLVTLQ